MKKIVITGPESTGKSYLAKTLSDYFKQAHTEEVARAYLNQLNRSYRYSDLYQIALEQMASEDAFLTTDIDVLFCDTDLITIKIWSSVKFGKVDKRILRSIQQRHYDLYLLCYPDIPWEPDPLRENPDNRPELFDFYLQELHHYGKNFRIIKGEDYNERLETAIQAVSHFFPDEIDGF